jgi:DNA-binding transcriptional MerR regulator/methylmalonyl-CoA mutase cobalamin-binding subunit
MPEYGAMETTPLDPTVPRHPISVVAQRTGLTPDVLRVWERRYGVVAPGRGGGGQRVYSDADIARLRLLRDATLAGRSIGQIAPLSTEELTRMVEEDLAARAEQRPDLDRREFRELVEAMVVLAGELDGARLDATLRRAAARLGLPQFLTGVAVPTLRRIGEEWHAGRLSPAHEHLASSIFHDIVADALRLAAPDPAGHVIVVATPAGERHVNGALAIAALAAVSGWNVTYLGADLPADAIAHAALAAGAAVVALSLTHADDRRRLAGEVRIVRDALPPAVALWVGGTGAATLGRDLLPAGVDVVDTAADVSDLLARFADRP